jgi:hypothetical protein
MTDLFRRGDVLAEGRTDEEGVKVWNGSGWGPDDPGKYPGKQRLLLTFAVKPNTSTAWLNYYSEPIDTLSLPRWQVAV